MKQIAVQSKISDILTIFVVLQKVFIFRTSNIHSSLLYYPLKDHNKARMEQINEKLSTMPISKS